ncbi:MAG: type II toxin-antitoxin system RelE/ParE family toxin [Acutalibacteraceae bacterium]|jgi:addiction module RelE/StbE family toxin
MAELLISPAANDDLIAIREYITKDLDSPKAAANTLNKIIKSIKRLIDFPLSGAPLESIIDFPNDYRFVVSGNYISFYRYADGTVFVDRVLYGGRDFVKILFGDLPEPSTDNN